MGPGGRITQRPIKVELSHSKKNVCYSLDHDSLVMQEKPLDQKDLNFKIQDVTTWFTNNGNTHLAQYLTKKGNQTMKFGQLIEYKRNIFLQKLCGKRGKETSSRPLYFFRKSLNEVKASGLQLSFNIFRQPST